MALYLWFLLAVTNEATATFRPRQLSPCPMVNMEVHCSNMNLRTVPLELPPGIRKLDLSQNLLQNLTEEIRAFYTSVYHLSFHSNRIEFIQPGLFKDMTNLEVLDLSRNYLDIFAMSNSKVGPLSSVKKLDLSGNGLYTGMTSNFLHNAPALLNLSLNGNSITKIHNDTFAGSLALRNIDLHNNVILEIEEGAFDYLPDLFELNLSMNSITCIKDFNLSQLKLLNLSQNSIESFETTESDLEFELLYLDLRENKIFYFPVLPKRNKLIYLDLSRNLLQSVFNKSFVNFLEHISYSSFQNHSQSLNKTLSVDRYIFPNLAKLFYLDLSYNEIKSIPTSFFGSMGSLEFLNLSNNCLEVFSVDDDSPLAFLETLDLSANTLQNLSFGKNALQSLKKLYLRGNLLSTLDPYTFLHLPSIEVLDLQQNILSVCGLQCRQPQEECRGKETGCVFLSSIPSLRYLYLSSNGLVALPRYAFYDSPLLLLDLSNNPGLEISKEAFTGLESSLTYLSFKGNTLQALNMDLSLFTGLKTVDLSSNQLTGLLLWNRESSIELLNLQNNSLFTLEYNTVLVLERALKTLYLSGNPLNCCSNPRFMHLIQKSAVDIPDKDSVTCRYMQDSEYKEINISHVAEEHCEEQERKSVSVIIIIVTALALIAALVLLSRCCHQRKRNVRGSFKA
ncbi:transforming growth factor beta activator LRRC32 isoform X2 [Lepisosteus oculatus]|uniref:Leucine rich repeat containing 32 n=2 Tax=Lepisosteus oculatus TaxID=7918 RepID=W5MBQ2_LEPOC|nr:PREDICTED: leucine-rich repeat-containing protein 32 isoform X1 [Lepisosteus oculatus]